MSCKYTKVITCSKGVRRVPETGRDSLSKCLDPKLHMKFKTSVMEDKNCTKGIKYEWIKEFNIRYKFEASL